MGKGLLITNVSFLTFILLDHHILMVASVSFTLSYLKFICIFLNLDFYLEVLFVVTSA